MLNFYEKGYEFTRDGKYMLLAERRDCKDYCSIFACDNWQLLKVLLKLILFVILEAETLTFSS